MATIRVDIESVDNASQNLQRTNREITNISESIARNRRALVDATGAERENLQQTNRRLSAEKGLLVAQRRRLNETLPSLREEVRAIRENTEATGILTRATRGLGQVLGGVGIALAAREIVQLGSESVQAAVKIESFTQAFAGLGLGAAGARRRIMELQEISDLPGVSFEQAVQGAIRLRVVGVEGERANAVITELGNALALTGDTDLSGAIRAITQIIQLQRVNQEEINQLVERSGAAAAALNDIFGTTRAESIQANLEASGRSVQDFVDLLTEGLARQARVSTDTAANAFQNYQNATFQLKATLGEVFLPTVTSVTRGLTGLFDRFREGIEGTQNFTQVIADLNAELSRASGTIQLREAIEGGIEALEAFIAQSEEAIRNNSVFFGGREDAILLGQIRQAREELQELQGVQEQNIETEADLRAELVRQEAELERIQGLQTERNNLIAEQGASARRASRIYLENLTEEEIAVIESIEGLEAKLAAYEAAGMAAEEATNTATEGTEEATTSTKDLTTEVQRLTEIYNDLATNVQQANEQFDLIQQSGFADFYRLVRGEIEAYGGAVDTVIPVSNRCRARATGIQRRCPIRDRYHE